MGSFVDPSLAGFLFTSAVLIGCGNLRSGGMARLVNLDAPPQVSTPLQGLARNFRRLDVDARAPCDPASRCHAWSHPRGLDDGDDHPGALFAGHIRAEYDRLWHPPQAGCCRWCDWQLLGPGFVARIGAQSSVFLAPTMMAVPFVIIALTSNPYVMGFALLSEMITAQLWNGVTVSYCQRLSPTICLAGWIFSIVSSVGS